MNRKGLIYSASPIEVRSLVLAAVSMIKCSIKLYALFSVGASCETFMLLFEGKSQKKTSDDFFLGHFLVKLIY